MSISQLQNFPTPTGFEPGAAKLIRLGDIENPVRLIPDLLRVLREVREVFPNQILAFAKDAVHWDKDAFRQPVSNAPRQGGWHLHLGYDTVNIANGSSIPTVITSDVMHAVAAIVKTIEIFMPAFREIEERSSVRVIRQTWVADHDIYSVEDSLTGHMTGIKASAYAILVASEVPFTEIQRVLDYFRFIVDKLKPMESGLAVQRAAQKVVPEQYRINLNPQDLGAYVIPEREGHARFLLGQPDIRPKGERNIVVTVDRATGELSKFMDMQQTNEGYDLVGEK